MSQRIRNAALTLGLVALAACGGDSGGPSNSNGSMSATIGGTSWTASLTVQGSYNSNVLSFAGNGGSGANTYQINITLLNVTAPGTYNFNAGSIGNIALVTQPGPPVATWNASGLAGSGSVTITSISSSRAQGTFSFTGAASGGTAATGTKAVTNGQFDVRF